MAVDRRTIAKVYAESFVDVADNAEENRAEIEAFVQILDDNPGIRTFFETPSVPHDEKQKMIDRTLKGQVSDVVYSFLSIVLKNGRFPIIDAIRDEIEAELDLRTNRVRATVKTYPIMSEDSLNQLKKALTDRFRSEFILKQVEAPELIGGFVVHFKDQLLDGSVRKELEKMKKSLRDIELPVGVLYEN